MEHEGDDYTNRDWYNSKCWLCKERDKTIDHVLNECYKLAQKETSHD